MTVRNTMLKDMKHKYVAFNNDDLFKIVSKTAQFKQFYLVCVRNIADESNVNALIDSYLFSEDKLEFVEKSHIILLIKTSEHANKVYDTMLEADPGACISLIHNGKLEKTTFRHFSENVMPYIDDEDEDYEEKDNSNVIYTEDLLVEEVEELSNAQKKALLEAGFVSVPAVLMAGIDTLSEIPGIDNKHEARIITKILDNLYINEDDKDDVQEAIGNKVEQDEFDNTY